MSVRLSDLSDAARARVLAVAGPDSPLRQVSPRGGRRRQPEAEAQRAVFAWADHPGTRHTYPVLGLLLHVANAGVAGGARRGAYLKAQGVRSGVPDLLLPVARGHFHGLAIELKAGQGRSSATQRHWLAALAEQGWACSVETGADAAIARIRWYLDGAVTP